MIDGEHSDLIGDKQRRWAGLIWSNTNSADHRVQICAVRIGQICAMRIGQICGVKILQNANPSASRVQICAVDARNVCRLSMPPLKHSQIIHWNDNHDDVDDGKSGQSGGNDRRGSFLTQGVGPREGAWRAQKIHAHIYAILVHILPYIYAMLKCTHKSIRKTNVKVWQHNMV